eukprot:TRINITY_DN1781_c0_g1_i2.p1 TRINITY_DN1781_c0_g1~~TRINITY_DN1781_c0_g1_i2.p1  ORF type:complete len:239 (+),score=56.97 TRINITY_DN1781_c0_g1_i2:66-719(+)
MAAILKTFHQRAQQSGNDQLTKHFMQIPFLFPAWIEKAILRKRQARFVVRRGATPVIGTDPSDFRDLVNAIRLSSLLSYSQLIDICGTDELGAENRFRAAYNFLSIRNGTRIQLHHNVKDEFDSIPSIDRLYGSANWLEREAYDMVGIFFEGSRDLRRILTDYGFRGHPMRKDFPLVGYLELRYDITKRRLVYEPVSLAQEYRFYDFASSWEQIVAL